MHVHLKSRFSLLTTLGKLIYYINGQPERVFPVPRDCPASLDRTCLLGIVRARMGLNHEADISVRLISYTMGHSPCSNTGDAGEWGY